MKMATSMPVNDNIIRMRSARMTTRDARSMQRVIVKQGYLKKLPNGAKLGSLFKKPERRWFIFGVISHTYPYLEYYDSEECIFNGTPLNTIFLDSCLYLTRNQRTARHTNVFTIVLKDRKLSLIADSRDLMNEWCCSIEDKLRSLRIINTVGGHNDYISVPAAARHRPVRSNTASERQLTTNENRSVTRITSQPVTAHALSVLNDNLSNTEAAVYETLRQDSSITGNSVVSENPYLVPASDSVLVNSVVSFEGHSVTQMADTDSHALSILHHNDASDSTLESHADWHQQVTSTRISQLPPLVTLPSYDESLLSSTSAPTTMDCSTLLFEDTSVNHASPPGYSSELVLALNTNAPLRLRQVQELKDEITRPNGVTIIIPKSQCIVALALVDYYDRVWIAGWNYRTEPHLTSQLHIGDQLTAINGQLISNTKSANSILKSSDGRMDAHLTIKRLPHAAVILVKKGSHYVDELGIETCNETSEVSFVDPSGLAARSGFPCYAHAIDDTTTSCNWWITEVNHQPLNLYYRNSEVRQRLNAAGSYLTFVAQPAPLIVELKRRLKTMKYFKDYLIE